MENTREKIIESGKQSEINPINVEGRSLDSAIESVSVPSVLHPTKNIRYEVDKTDPGIVYWYYQKKPKEQLQEEVQKVTYLTTAAVETQILKSCTKVCGEYEDLAKRAKKYRRIGANGMQEAVLEKYLIEPIQSAINSVQAGQQDDLFDSGFNDFDILMPKFGQGSGTDTWKTSPYIPAIPPLPFMLPY